MFSKIKKFWLIVYISKSSLKIGFLLISSIFLCKVWKSFSQILLYPIENCGEALDKTNFNIVYLYLYVIGNQIGRLDK